MGRWVCLSLLFVTIAFPCITSIAQYCQARVNSGSTSNQRMSTSSNHISQLTSPHSGEGSTEMNANDCSSEHLCFNSTAPDVDYALIGDLIKVLAIVTLLIACPLVILLNALVIMAIKTKRRLQTRGNILLASLAGTDLAMGLTSQPAFIALEIFRLAGGSLSVYGTLFIVVQSAMIVLCLASLFHLVLISADRFVAMKIFVAISHDRDQIPRNTSSGM